MRVGNMFYCHSAKKFLPIIKELPKEAEFYKYNTSCVPEGMILEDERKNKTLYHVHRKGGSDPKKFGKYGSHEVWIMRG